jgi:hypothetical protein
MNTDSVYTDTLSKTAKVANSANSGWGGFDLQFWRIAGIVLIIAIGVSFILVVIKLLLDHRLKSKIVEKDLPEERIRLILGNGLLPLKEAALKWSLTAAGVAAGLLIAGIAETGPALSMAFIAACVAASFGLYYLITKNENE